MTPMDVMAFIFAIAVLAKIWGAVINPKASLKIVIKALKHKTALTVSYLVLIVVVAVQVFAVLSIEQVASVLLLAALLLGLSLVPYGNTAYKLAKHILGKELVRKEWLSLAIWIGLAGWAFFASLV
jgi:hypothetical protein